MRLRGCEQNDRMYCKRGEEEGGGRSTFGDGVCPGTGTVEVERTAVEDLGEVGLSVGLP